MEASKQDRLELVMDDVTTGTLASCGEFLANRRRVAYESPELKKYSRGVALQKIGLTRTKYEVWLLSRTEKKCCFNAIALHDVGRKTFKLVEETRELMRIGINPSALLKTINEMSLRVAGVYEGKAKSCHDNAVRAEYEIEQLEKFVPKDSVRTVLEEVQDLIPGSELYISWSVTERDTDHITSLATRRFLAAQYLHAMHDEGKVTVVGWSDLQRILGGDPMYHEVVSTKVILTEQFDALAFAKEIGPACRRVRVV